LEEEEASHDRLISGRMTHERLAVPPSGQRS